jgi:hypothetical protein
MSGQPIAWGIPRPDGTIIDCITPEEHAREPGQYTVPLYAAPQPKAEQEPVALAEQLQKSVLWPVQQKEPVGVVEYLMASNDGWLSKLPPGTKLYTAPQPRRRLDVHEILDLMPEGVPARYDGELIAFCRAIEAAVWGEKT